MSKKKAREDIDEDNRDSGGDSGSDLPSMPSSVGSNKKKNVIKINVNHE